MKFSSSEPPACLGKSFSQYRSPWRDRDGGGGQLLQILGDHLRTQFQWTHILRPGCTSTKFGYVHVTSDAVKIGQRASKRGQRAALVFDFLDSVMYFDLRWNVQPGWIRNNSGGEQTVVFPVQEMAKCTPFPA